MLLPHSGWWDRQPTSATRIRSDMIGLGLVHALMPGFDNALYVLDYARPNAAPPTNTGYRGNSVYRANPMGVAMQMHPFAPNETGDTPSNNAVKTLRFPVVVSPTDDLTVIWCGYIDTPGGAGGLDGYGALWSIGADGSGNGWGAQQRAMSGGQIRAMTVDSSPAQYVTDVQMPGGIAQNTYVAAAYRQTGNRVTSFSGAGHVSASSNQGNGARRSSGIGLDLAGSGNNSPSNNGVPGGTATGHNRCLVCLVFRRALTDEQIFSLLDNPWQAWANESTALFIPASAVAQGVDLAAAPGVSQPQGASVAITQAHKLVAAPGLSQVALGVGAVSQSHVIAAAGGISQPAAASVAVGQAHVLAAAAGVSQPAGASVAVSQAHLLVAAPGTSTPIGQSVAIVTSGQLQASPGVSQPVGGAVAVTQVHVLSVSPGVSTPTGAAVAITQAHRLAAAPGTSLAMAGSVAIVQRHVLAAALGTSQPVGPSVSLSTESSFEASIWRKYRVPAEDRMFKIAAEQRKFGVTDG